MPTAEKIKEIKRSFRPLMNGVTASSMREKGAAYRINWGVSMADLQCLASEYGKDKALAEALWVENVRECKILATLIMPPEQMSPTLTEQWLTEMPTQEMAEWAAFHLFQYVEGIAPIALRAIRSAHVNERICGFHILSRLFLKGYTVDKASEKAFLTAAKTSANEGEMGERHAAANCLTRYER